MFPNDEELFLKQLVNAPVVFKKRVTGSNRWRFIAWCLRKGIVEKAAPNPYNKSPSYIVKYAFEVPDIGSRTKLYPIGNRISFSNTRMR